MIYSHLFTIYDVVILECKTLESTYNAAKHLLSFLLSGTHKQVFLTLFKPSCKFVENGQVEMLTI